MRSPGRTRRRCSALTDQFNSSQQDVSVRLVNQIGYKENLEKFRAGLGGTDLPDLIMVEDTATQQMIDTQAHAARAVLHQGRQVRHA